MFIDVKGYKECSECGQMFYLTHNNQKYCCLYCAEQAQKKLLKERWKKYIKNEKNYTKHKIRTKTNYLIHSNKIQKHNCAICGTSKHIQAHHPYYNDSCISVVVWLCKHCHQQLHKEMAQ